jgi:dolichol-phosphate mannosyltransferase
MDRILIAIPTYNERGNVEEMCAQIFGLGLPVKLLFVDDNSPDGTGQLLDELKSAYPNLIVKHRPGKLGIGTAHKEIIEYAYDEGFSILVTMDCDFTHSPTDIPELIQTAASCDVAVGSRWLRPDSLLGWNLYRRCITTFGHFLTRELLAIPQDANGSFRAYRLDRIVREVFRLVKSKGYSFFFESLFILNRNNFAIREVPLVLSARTYGTSKMSTAAAWNSASYIFQLFFENLRNPEQFLLARTRPEFDSSLIDPQKWDGYWKQESKSGAVYELIAGIYRRAVIKQNLDRVIKHEFLPCDTLLHAGCGSGQVDTDIQRSMRIVALDISPTALERYCRNNPNVASVKHGDLFNLPFPDGSFDGVYNLGVVEHFSEGEIARIFSECRRVLVPGGKLVLFWPHARATSVFVLKWAHLLMNLRAKKRQRLHPPEITLCRGKQHAQSLLTAEFPLRTYEFSIRDFFVQAIVVAEKPGAQDGRRK